MPSREYKELVKKLDERRKSMTGDHECYDQSESQKNEWVPEPDPRLSDEEYDVYNIEELKMCDASFTFTPDDSAKTIQYHGHPMFYTILDELKDLHSRKNRDYAMGGSPLGNFQRRADLYSHYPGLDLSDRTVVAIVDAMKQLDAALWLLSNKHKAEVEGVTDRLKDVAVYSVLAMIMRIEDKKENETRT